MRQCGCAQPLGAHAKRAPAQKEPPDCWEGTDLHQPRHNSCRISVAEQKEIHGDAHRRRHLNRNYLRHRLAAKTWMRYRHEQERHHVHQVRTVQVADVAT